MLQEHKEKLLPMMEEAQKALEEFHRMTGDIGYLGIPASIRASSDIADGLRELLYLQIGELNKGPDGRL